jgi:hypothetical protein
MAMGYELDTATNGRDVIRRLLSSPDYELALLDVTLERPTLNFLLPQLRHDSRTAKLTVGIIARGDQLERARHLARRDPLAEAFSRPHTQETVDWQVGRLIELVGRERVLPAERGQQAAQAIRWLADLSGRDQQVFELAGIEEVALAAVHTPGMSNDAVTILGNLASPASQRALVELASRWTQPIELRTAAAEGFDQSVRRNGILLTTQEILAQYDRYNASETLDQATQQVLGSILDTIEAPTRAQEPAQDQAKESANVTIADGSATRAEGP